MPKYRYTVVNKDNRQLVGVVETPDEKSARDELQELGFSIVALKEEEKKEQKEQSGLLFEFSGIDEGNRKVTGSIHSSNRYTAFRRLITEYSLDIQYIVQDDLDKAEKIKQKKLGVMDLMKKYQKEVKKKTDLFHKKKIKQIDRNFEDQKALVMRQVDFVLNKVKEAVDKFGKELNAQDKQTIKDHVNKILRLKSSTNLDYIKQSCKDLLEFLQHAEIFMHKKDKLTDKVKLYADSQEMIETIQRGKDFGVYEDLEDQINRWKSTHIKGKKNIPFMDKLKDVYYNIVLKFIQQPEEVRLIKKGITKTNHDLKQYYSIYIKSKDKNYRTEASDSIKKLRQKKKNLKDRLGIARTNARKEQKAEEPSNIIEYVIDVVNGVTGWLLFFYLLYYFVSTIIITKQIGFPQNNIPSAFYLFQTGNIKYILPIVFFLHISTSLKLLYFRKNVVANAVLVPAFFLATILIMFNF